LAALADTAQKYDTDGIDIYFLNNRTKALNIKVHHPIQRNIHFNALFQSSSEVRALFAKVGPSGATPTGERLDQILKPRLCILEQAQKDGRIEPDGTPMDKSGKEIKRVNLIVITDGEASTFTFRCTNPS
jgi:hypothetical protein